MRYALIPLGPFDLDAPIGRGSLGQVWSAIHREQGIPVAVKVLTHQAAKDHRFRAGFRNEVRAVAGLDHPGIVMILDLGDVGVEAARRSSGRLVANSPYLAMELATGGTLRDRVRAGGAAGWPELRENLISLLDALAHAHARGIIHLDLKLSNVLVCRDTDVRPGLKLSDFNVSYAMGDERSLAIGPGTMGTVPYMAPEQLRSWWRDYGPWTDLYALGCVAFELACGKRAFDGDGLEDIALAHLRGGRADFRPYYPVPVRFERWLDSLLAVDYRNRFQSAADAAWALLALESDAWLEPPADAPTIPMADLAPTTTLTLTWIGPIAEPDEAPATTTTVAGGADGDEPWPLPPLPASWKRPAPDRPSMQLLGAGLRLYGVRAVPLVDRDAERERLWRAIVRVGRRGHGEAALLLGGAGFGKSRLAEWLCERVQELGAARVLRAQHHRTAGPIDGLGLMIARYLRCAGLDRDGMAERIERWYRAQGVTDADEWHALTELIMPATDEELEAGTPPVRFETAVERHVLMRRFLERLARDRPVVVWLDDVEYGHDALAFAHHLLEAQALTPSRVLLVLTAQDEQLALRRAEGDLVQRLLARDDVQRLDVGPLPIDDQPRLVRELLALEPQLAEEVQQRTAGNPLFALQVVGHWAHRGLLVPGPDGLRLIDPAAREELPSDLEKAWARRVDRLLEGRTEAEAQGLELAAVLGHEVEADEWEAVCRVRDLQTPWPLVDDLVAQRLARASRDGPRDRWEFVHGMLRESIERRARKRGRWGELNLACAETLAERPRAKQHERLARHLLAAEAHERALGPLLRAAEHRLNLGDFEIAEALLREREMAVFRLELTPDDRRQTEGWLLRARLCSHEGKYDQAESWAQRTIEAARPGGWSDLLAEALLELGQASVKRGQNRRAEAFLREAAQEAEAAGQASVRAEARLVRGGVLVRRGRMEEARRLLADRGAGDDAYHRARCEWTLTFAAVHDGRLEDAQQHGEQLLSLAQRAGARMLVAGATNLLGEVARARGDLDAAERHYAESIERFEATGHPNAVVSKLNMGLVLVERGRFQEARALFEEGLKQVMVQGRRHLVAAAHALHLPCAAADRDWGAWDHHMTEARRLIAACDAVEPDVARAAELAAAEAQTAGAVDRARAAYQLALEQWRALDRTERVERLEAALAALPGDD